MAVGWDAYDLNAILAGTAGSVVVGNYIERLYTVTYANGSTAAFTMKTEINAETGYIATEGYEIEKIVYISENGAETVVTGGKFLMPAGDVRVVITERAKTAVVVVNGENVTGTIGDVITFEIRLAADEVLSEAPADARLVSFTTDPDGSRVLLYAVDVTESTPNLSYRTEKRDPAESRITNGVVNGIANKNEGKIVRYNVTEDTTFPSAVYSFAVYENEGPAASPLWLILLIVILVIAIFVMLYLIITRRGPGPNLFTRVILAIATAFFTACLGVHALFSGRLFRKK